MSSVVATIVYVIGIAVLLVLVRDRKVQTSNGLWIAILWLLIAGSRPVAAWFDGPTTATASDIAQNYNMEANPANTLVIVVLLTGGLIVLIRRNRTVAGLLRANWPILLFFSYCILSTGWSDYPGPAFRKAIRSLGDFMAVLIVVSDRQPAAALKRLLVIAGFLLLPLSLLLIKYYPNLGRMYGNDWGLMYTGVTEHKNSLGVICMVFGLGFLWCLLEEYRAKNKPHRRQRLLALGIGLGTAIWLLAMANSVTSSSCFSVAAFLLLSTRLPMIGRKRWITHLMAAGLVSLSLFAIFLDPGSGLIQAMGRNATLTGRTAIWGQVINLAGNPLFGAGYESFWLGNRLQRMWMDNPGARLNEAHNGYLEVYLNLGWCGISLLALLIVAGYRNVISAFRIDRNVGGLKLAFFVASIIYCLTEAGFRMTSPVWISFLLASTAVPQLSARRVPFSSETADLRQRWAREYRGTV